MKSVQIPYDIFVALVEYHLAHSGGYVTANIYTDQTPKETYPYFFVTNIGLTTLGCVLTVALYMLFGLV